MLIVIMRLRMDLLRAIHRPVTVEDTEDIIPSRRRSPPVSARAAEAATLEMSEHLTRLHDLSAIGSQTATRDRSAG